MSTTETAEKDEIIEGPRTGPSVSYALTDKGVITRHDRKQPGAKPLGIAVVVDGKVRLARGDFAKYENMIRKLLKAHGLVAEIEPYVQREPVILYAQAVAGGEAVPAEVNESVGVDGMAGLTVEQRKAVNYLRSKEGFPMGSLERPIPPEPAKTSGAGDKTPAFVLWLLRYDPARFVRTYGVVGFGSIEVTVPGKVDPVTHVKKPATRRWESGHVLARRETILTKVVRVGKQDGNEEGV